MQRYFISKSQLHQGHILIEGEDVKHISRVMRMAVGDRIICCTEDGQ
ncbi:RNA methyltransferase PUA domain-containing protein, partial [Staphylococcus sp. SIMBA_130]